MFYRAGVGKGDCARVGVASGEQGGVGNGEHVGHAITTGCRVCVGQGVHASTGVLVIVTVGAIVLVALGELIALGLGVPVGPGAPTGSRAEIVGRGAVAAPFSAPAVTEGVTLGITVAKSVAVATREAVALNVPVGIRTDPDVAVADPAHGPATNRTLDPVAAGEGVHATCVPDRKRVMSTMPLTLQITNPTPIPNAMSISNTAYLIMIQLHSAGCQAFTPAATSSSTRSHAPYHRIHFPQ